MQLHTADGARKYLTASERDLFLKTVKRGDRDARTLCMTLAYAGCRLSEAFALTADRVDLAAGRIASPELLPRACLLPHLNAPREAAEGATMRVSMATRRELLVAIRGRYASVRRCEKAKILDEFVALTGFHRKHAMRLLRGTTPPSETGLRPGRRMYREDVRAKLVTLWGASDRICGKRL
jgi:integrase